MRLVMVLGLDPSPETQIKLIDRCYPFQIQPLDELASKRSPGSFNLAFRWRITGAAVHQMDSKTCTQQPQIIAAEAGMIIQQQFAHDAAAGHGLIENRQKTLFGFAKTAFQIRNEPAPVIDEPEDDHALVS